MTSTAAFISELIRAADGIDRLTRSERAKLLERAADTISNLCEIAQFLPKQAEQDIVFVKELRDMARLIRRFSDEEVATSLKSAVAIIALDYARAKGKLH